MKISKERLKQIIKEEVLNEISPRTFKMRGGFKGIEFMSQQAEWALDNLEQKFDGEPPEEIYTIQKFLEAIKKSAWWAQAAHAASSALHQMDPDEYEKQ